MSEAGAIRMAITVTNTPTLVPMRTARFQSFSHCSITSLEACESAMMSSLVAMVLLMAGSRIVSRTSLSASIARTRPSTVKFEQSSTGKVEHVVMKLASREASRSAGRSFSASTKSSAWSISDSVCAYAASSSSFCCAACSAASSRVSVVSSAMFRVMDSWKVSYIIATTSRLRMSASQTMVGVLPKHPCQPRNRSYACSLRYSVVCALRQNSEKPLLRMRSKKEGSSCAPSFDGTPRAANGRQEAYEDRREIQVWSSRSLSRANASCSRASL
eukprot:scaffold2119_cov264-Pinguiococcus_pyrenoidosus.AAC.8